MKKIFNKQKTSKKLFLYDMCMSGVFIGLLFAVRAIFKYVDIINGYSLQIQMLFFAISLFFIRTLFFKIGFWLLSPFALLVFGIGGHIIFDYLLPYWGFGLFITFDYINEKLKTIDNKKFRYFLIIMISFLFNIVGYVIMLFSYTTSGVVFWGVSWKASIITNGPIVGISAAINIVVMMITIIPLTMIDKKIHAKIFY